MLTIFFIFEPKHLHTENNSIPQNNEKAEKNADFDS